MSMLKDLRSKVELLALFLTVVGTVIYFYFGINYNILNAVIVVLLIAALAIAAAGIALRNNWMTILSEVALTLGFMYIIQDSIATFVDWYNGTAMFGGTGRMDLVFAILGFTCAAIVVQIVSCFMKDK